MAKDPLSGLFERPPSKPAPSEGSASLAAFDQHADRIGKAIGAKLSEYRHEAGIAAVPAAGYGALVLAAGQDPTVAAVQLFVLVMILLAIPAVRRAIQSTLAAGRVRRRWDQAADHCKIPPHARITRVTPTWAGYRVQMRVSRGLSFDLITSRAEPLAASMRVGSIKVRRDPKDASRGTLTLIDRNPLLEQVGDHWPAVANDAEPSLWDPFPIGIDEHGQQVNICLVQKHLLVGGITGGGKSILVSMPLAIAALDPSVRLFLLDAKGGVEFAPWARCAEAFATSVEEGIDALVRVKALMHERLAEMRDRGVSEGRVIRGITRDLGWPLIFVAIDELARFTDHGDKKLREEFNALLDEIIALGRSPGCILLGATQKPEGSVLPTRTRDQFPYRMALRCSTPQASDTILGQGWAAQGFNAQRISEQEKGVGYLLSEESSPIRMRTYFLSDEDVFALAERARQARQGTNHHLRRRS